MRTSSRSSGTTSRAASSGRQRNERSLSLMTAARARTSLRSSSEIFRISNSSRSASRSAMRRPVVPEEPSTKILYFPIVTPLTSKGFSRGGSCRPQAADEGKARKRVVPARPPLISQRAGPLTASPKGEATQRAKPLVSSGHLPPMGKAFMPAFPSHPQPASSRLPSSGRRSWCGPRSRSSGRWPYKRHPQTGRCTA